MSSSTAEQLLRVTREIFAEEHNATDPTTIPWFCNTCGDVTYRVPAPHHTWLYTVQANCEFCFR